MDKKEYIERGALLEEMQDRKYANPENYFQRGVNASVDILTTDIKHIPAADVVEVCRCKDCKHWDEKYKCCIMMGLTALGDSYFYENSFCSRGERKEVTP